MKKTPQCKVRKKPSEISGKSGWLPERGNIARKIHRSINETVPDLVNYEHSTHAEFFGHNTPTNTTMATKEGGTIRASFAGIFLLLLCLFTFVFAIIVCTTRNACEQKEVDGKYESE